MQQTIMTRLHKAEINNDQYHIAPYERVQERKRVRHIRKLFLTLFLLVPLLGYAQDLIILRSGEQIKCQITKIDSSTVHYDFYKGERKISSYVSLSEIHSYKTDAGDTDTDDPNSLYSVLDNTVVIDTSQYVKERSRWINMVTFSQRYGIHAEGWSVQYYGYNLRNTSRWSVPVIFGIDILSINNDYFAQSDYVYASMSYFNAGIIPFYKLNDYFFLSLGANVMFGGEELEDYYGRESSHTFFGIAPSQGIFFISRSKVGITAGISLYEKILSSKVYKNDLGLKLEFGIKF